MIKKLIGLVVLSLSLQAALFAEGLAPETRVYTYYGALELQELWVGIEVQCLSADGKIVMGEVEAIEKIEAPVYYTFIVNGKKYGTSGTQLFYCVNQQKWLKFCEFEPDKDFVVVDYRKAGRIENCQEVLPLGCVYDKKAKSMEEFLDLVELIPGLSGPRYVYRISIKDHHTFFIDGGILCHNWLVLVPPLYYLAAEFLIMTGVSVVLSAAATYVVVSAAEAARDISTKTAHERWKKSHDASREVLNNPNKIDNQPQQETPQSDQGSNQETKQVSGQEPNNQDPEDPNNGGKKALAGAAGAAATNSETRKAVVDGATKVVETGSKVIDKASKVVSKVSNAAGKASKAASRASRVAGKASKTAGKASDLAGKNSNTAGNLPNTLDNASKTGNAAVVKPAPNATPKATTQQAAPTQSSAKPATTQQATPKQATTPKQPTQNATQASAKQGTAQQQPQPAQNTAQQRTPKQATPQQAQPAQPAQNPTQSPVNTTATQNQPAPKPDDVVNKMINESTAGKQSKDTAQFIKNTNDASQPRRDFDQFNPANVKQTPKATIGELSDKRIIHVRPDSSGGAPTLEIYDPETKQSIKFRYTTDPEKYMG